MTAETVNESYRQGVAQVAENVFDTMLKWPIQPRQARPAGDHYELTAAVYYVGEWKGALLLECSLDQAKAWSARLMQLEGEVSDEDARDGLGEMCNILAGNLKPLLPPGVGISTPSVVKGADYTLRILGEPLCERLGFADETGEFRVTLVIG